MKNRFLLMLAGLGLAATAQAQITVPTAPGGSGKTSLYGQIGLGGAHADFACPGQSRCDTGGRVARVIGGLRYGDGWGFEIGALSFGNFDHKQRADDSHQDSEGSALWLATAWHAELSPQWVLSYRLGLASARSRTGVRLFGGGQGSARSRSETAPYGGLSLGYRFNKVLSLQLGADMLRVPVRYASGDSESMRLSAFTLGLGLNF